MEGACGRYCELGSVDAPRPECSNALGRLVDDIFEPWQRLVRIVVLGRVFRVPERNILLRQLQYVSEDVGSGRYCWNAECRYCEVHYTVPGDPREHVGLACRLRGIEGMRLTRVAPEVRHTMADALAQAPREEGTPS
jgi:hypothetical protein